MNKCNIRNTFLSFFENRYLFFHDCCRKNIEKHFFFFFLRIHQNCLHIQINFCIKNKVICSFIRQIDCIMWSKLWAECRKYLVAFFYYLIYRYAMINDCVSSIYSEKKQTDSIRSNESQTSISRKRGSKSKLRSSFLLSQLASPHYSLTQVEKMFLLYAERGDCASVKK